MKRILTVVALLAGLALVPSRNAYGEKKSKDEAQREKAERKAAKVAQKDAARAAKQQEKSEAQARIDAKAALKAQEAAARKAGGKSKSPRDRNTAPATQITAPNNTTGSTATAVQSPRTARQTPAPAVNGPPTPPSTAGIGSGKLSFAQLREKFLREQAEKQRQQSSSGTEFDTSREYNPQ